MLNSKELGYFLAFQAYKKDDAICPSHISYLKCLCDHIIATSLALVYRIRQMKSDIC